MTSSDQLGRGQAMRLDEALQMSRQLQGHRTYFFPTGAARIGYKLAKFGENNLSKMREEIKLVAQKLFAKSNLY